MQQAYHEQPGSETALPLRPLRILVVDDDPGIRALCGAVLRADGFEVTEAADGREGLARAVSNPPDLVLLDVSMPILDGFSTAVALRNNEPTRDIRLVFITGEQAPEVEGHAYNVGAVGLLAKPFEPEALSALVKRVLEPFRSTAARPLSI